MTIAGFSAVDPCQCRKRSGAVLVDPSCQMYDGAVCFCLTDTVPLMIVVKCGSRRLTNTRG